MMKEKRDREEEGFVRLHNLAEAMRKHWEMPLREVLRASREKAIRVGDVDLVVKRFIRRAA